MKIHQLTGILLAVLLTTLCAATRAQQASESEQERLARRLNKQLDRQESANRDVRKNMALSSDGSGRMPLWGPERHCAGLKKFGPKDKPIPECPMTKEAYCAMIYAKVERDPKYPIRATICPPKGK